MTPGIRQFTVFRLSGHHSYVEANRRLFDELNTKLPLFSPPHMHPSTIDTLQSIRLRFQPKGCFIHRPIRATDVHQTLRSRLPKCALAVTRT
jgi:hypothetical protein